MQTSHLIFGIGLLLGAVAILARLVFNYMRSSGELKPAEASEVGRDAKWLRGLKAPINAALAVVYGFTLIVLVYALFTAAIR